MARPPTLRRFSKIVTLQPPRGEVDRGRKAGDPAADHDDLLLPDRAMLSHARAKLAAHASVVTFAIERVFVRIHRNSIAVVDPNLPRRCVMRKTVVGVLLLLCATVGFAADRPAAPEIAAPANGDDWLKLSSSEKRFWSIGYSLGYQDALDKLDVTSGAGTPCATLAARTERQSSTAGKVSGFELVSGLERFYSDPANTTIPVGAAIRIYLLQASGKDQATVQELIDTARLLGAQFGQLPVLLAARERGPARCPHVPSLLEQRVVELPRNAQHAKKHAFLRAGRIESDLVQPAKLTLESGLHDTSVARRCASTMAESTGHRRSPHHE